MQAIGTGGGVVNDITTFGQTLMQVFGSFKLVLDDKDSHDLSPLSFNGCLIKAVRKVVVFVGPCARFNNLMPGTVKAEVATGSTNGAFKPALRDTLSQLVRLISETSISASAVWQIIRAYVFRCITTTPFALRILEQNNFR